ncbi:MAG: purine-cytosine permease family protein, partial [Planctomycetota bacterium]
METPAGLSTLAARLDALNEFDREPIPPEKLRGGRHFAAIYGGEHVAGTEFVIGSLFVLGGVSARDLVLGLIAGNVLAVLSWTFICAPIATRVRLTLYWYLRKVAGPGLCVIYCLANALLFSFLAGAMIALCADAVSHFLARLGLEFAHPSLSDVYPSNPSWVALVLVSGGLVTALAILGFDVMAKFASVCVPWMFLIFIAAALSVLARPEMGLRGLGDLPRVAAEKIWTGEPVAGQAHLGFWHVASFAWFCNLSTHVDLSDMAIFRYARHWSYGLYSAIGMFLGHFLAWLSSGVICAPFRDLIVATGNRDPSLSVANLAYGTAGLSGVLCVLFASWSTANPTLYRAGLALQVATPNWARWKVTLAAGAVTSIAACFPVFVMQLLGFVAIFGLVLMPVGAVVFAEHWIVPRVGLAPYWAERRRLFLNPAAVLTWAASLAFCFFVLHGALGVELFFLWLPGYLFALLLYPILAAVFGARIPGADTA